MTKELLRQAMPICAAYGVKSKYGFDPANGHKQLIGLSIGRPGTVFDDQIVELFTADQMHAYAIAAIAQPEQPAIAAGKPMNPETYEAPDLSHISTDDLCALMRGTAMSHAKSDKDFAKACRDEIAKRKPEKKSTP